MWDGAVRPVTRSAEVSTVALALAELLPKAGSNALVDAMPVIVRVVFFSVAASARIWV